MQGSIAVLSLLGLLLLGLVTGEDECTDGTCLPQSTPTRVPDNCTLVYAPVAGDRWGVFSLTDRKQRTPVWNFGDIVIQLTDLKESKVLADLFVWAGQETGGHDEGKKTVHSVVPGLGMMTSTSRVSPNLLPFAPRVDEGGLTRFENPGTGAITHYHNYTWFVTKPVEAGEELIMSSSLRVHQEDNAESRKVEPPKPSLNELKEHGYCLDSLRPRKSRLKEAGRGAFATRSMNEGDIVAPVPVIPIAASALTTKVKQKQQLLKNYCLGNLNSTILLYPFAPMVNLINHFPQPNVKLQWSKQSGRWIGNALTPEEMPLLMLELVATRPIRYGEELYLDYGKDWEQAWWNHVQTWKPIDMHYTPSYVMDDAIKLMRTQQEQKGNEYPDNLFTSCFYRFSDRDSDEKTLHQPENAKSVTSFKWKFTKGLYDLKHLRPCEVIKRNEDAKGRSGYAVRMLNRPGLDSEEVIPKGGLHIVTHVPRSAIRFSDKAGTTDTHLATAFRHEISLGDEFPRAWRDLEMQ